VNAQVATAVLTLRSGQDHALDGRRWADRGLWHKDREVVTYSYGLPWARVIAVP
jgi:hypothetical protein